MWPTRFDLAAMICKPFGGVLCDSLLVSELGIALDNVLAIIGDCVAELIVAGERRILFPALRQAAQATKRECLYHRLLEPLARTCRLGVRLPAISQDVPELMAK